MEVYENLQTGLLGALGDFDVAGEVVGTTAIAVPFPVIGIDPKTDTGVIGATIGHELEQLAFITLGIVVLAAAFLHFEDGGAVDAESETFG